MKGAFPRCWKCGSEWSHCHDSSFVPPEFKQAYDQQNGQQPPWNGASWQSQGSGSRSPRTRGKKHNHRGRHQGGDHQHQDKGYGKGQSQVPMPPMMPMMLQYPPHMMPAPLQPPVVQMPGSSPMMDKGTGKGMAHSMVPPPPPMPSTGTMSQPPGAPTTWTASMSTMPFPTAPPAPAVPAPQEAPSKEGQAQKNLNRLLKELKKEEDTLSPALQSMAHEMKKQDEKSNMKGLHLAVRALGDAKDALLEAENARVQLLSQWKHFLQQSVVKWKEFTMNFQASDSAHHASVQAARLAVRKAQRTFDLASKREHVGKNEPWPISDEEEEATEGHDGGHQRGERAENSRWYVLHCDEPRGTVILGRPPRAEGQEAKDYRHNRRSSGAVFWRGRRYVTDEYSRQGPLLLPVMDIQAVRLHWSHSILQERDFLPVWQAQTHASDPGCRDGIQ